MNTGIILGNSIIDVVFVAWFIAQSYKVIASIFSDNKIKLKRFWETGGMPSSHSSTVSSLTTAIGIVYGTATPLFAISLFFAIIVMHDAAGIRRSAGQQASVINQLRETLSSVFDKPISEVKLKELLGHTPIEVLVGAILGIIVSFVFKFHLV